jgi:hypothetical protein
MNRSYGYGARRKSGQPSSRLMALLHYSLTHLDPDCDHEQWMKIGSLLHYETGGSEEAFELYDDWSARSRRRGNYPGRRAMERRWTYYEKPLKRPVTLGTLRYYLKQAGVSWSEIEEHVDKFYVESDEEGA